MLWINQPQTLFDINKLRYFFPCSKMTWEEQANACIRFTMYLSFLLFLYHNNYAVLFLPVIFMSLLQFYLFRQGKLPTLMRTLFGPKAELEGFINRHPDPNVIFDNEIPNLEHPIQDDLEKNPTLAQGRQFAKLSQIPDPTQPQAKQIFKDTQAHRFAQSAKYNISSRMNNGCYPGEPSFQPQQIVCKPSSEANPFNNALPYDPIDRQIYPSCPNEDIKTDNFHKNLFKDVNDVFNKANGQLNFHSNPATTKINDREAFMQFLFNTPYVEYPEGA